MAATQAFSITQIPGVATQKLLGVLDGAEQYEDNEGRALSSYSRMTGNPKFFR